MCRKELPMDWQPFAVGIIVVLAAIYLIRNALQKKGCGGSCGCSKPVEKVRNAEHWVGELQLKTREKS